MITRRGFLKAFTTVVAGAAVATHIPVEWMPTQVLRTETALSYLRRAYNRWADEHHRAPYLIMGGPRLFEAVEQEMMAIQRIVFTAPATCGYCDSIMVSQTKCLNCGASTEGYRKQPDLMFKGSRLRLVSFLKDWDYSIA